MELNKQRLEAFSDGVIAIIITIMVLSIPLPKESTLSGIMMLLYTVFVYFTSFVVVGEFWSRHHRIFSYIEKVNAKIIWINLLFLFFLSLIPLFTKWVMENYGLLAPAIGYAMLYLVVNLCYIFIFHFVIQHSDHEAIKSLVLERQEKRDFMEKNGHGDYRNDFLWLRFAITAIVIIAVVVLSLSFRKVSTVLLLGVPIVFSVVNLVFEDYKHAPKKRK